MIWEIPNEFDTLDKLPRLLQEDVSPDYRAVRVYKLHDKDYIQLEDYLRFENNNDALYHIVMENNLSLDKIDFVVDETHIIDNPHMIKSAKHIVNPNNLVVKRMNTDNYAKSIKEAIDEFESTNDSTNLDILLERKSWIIDAGARGIAKGAKEGFKTTTQVAKKNLRNLGLLAGGLGAASFAANKVVNHIADKDARIPIHSGKRSELIKKLRVLNGKYEEYESKYDKADYQRKNIIGKILYKLKMAIKRLKGQIA